MFLYLSNALPKGGIMHLHVALYEGRHHLIMGQPHAGAIARLFTKCQNFCTITKMMMTTMPPRAKNHVKFCQATY